MASSPVNGGGSAVMNGHDSPPLSLRKRSESGLTEEERAKQREYWAQHSKKGSNMENMMLDHSAQKLDLLDRPEVLSLLPPFKGKRVLELASGIGRFTGSIAAEAESVVTVEFMEDFLNKNRELHGGKFANVDFICSDVLQLDLEPSSFDMVFSCWIHMYLGDEEVCSLTLKSLGWLKPGGHIFLRESCFRQSGDVSRTFNPSHYRHPSFYTQVFAEAEVVEESTGEAWGLELVRTRNLEAYVEVKGNKGQICWLLRKVPRSQAMKTTAAPLSLHTSLWGHGCNSRRVGGEWMAKLVTEAIAGTKGRVLELGCGLGASSVAMAQAGAKLWAVDECPVAVQGAIESAMGVGREVHTVFEAVPSGKTGATGVFEAAVVHEPPVSSNKDATTDGIHASALSEAMSRLRSGGTIVVATFLSDDASSKDNAIEALSAVADDVTLHDHTNELTERLTAALDALKARSPKAETEHALCADVWGARLERLRNNKLKFALLKAHKPGAVSNGHAQNGDGHANGHHHA